MEGENAYHAIFGNGYCAIVHPSATAVALVALGALVDRRAAAAGEGAQASSSIYLHPEQDVTRRALARPSDIVDAIRVPASSPARLRVHQVGEKES